MTKNRENASSKRFRLSPAVRDLGYTGSPIPLDEWLSLRAIIESSAKERGRPRVNLPPVTICCAHCNAEAVRTSADVRKHLLRGLLDFFCSNACWARAQNDQRFGRRACVNCDKDLPRSAKTYGTPARGRMFCSEACMAQFREANVKRLGVGLNVCKHCKVKFYPAHHMDSFCSPSCAELRFLSKHAEARLKALRPLALRRDDNRCVRCRSEENLEVHHRDGDQKNHSLENLQTLCAVCHEGLHILRRRVARS